jgi:hypothetical protein
VHFFARRNEAARRWIDSASPWSQPLVFLVVQAGPSCCSVNRATLGRCQQSAALSSDPASRRLAEITLGLVEIATGDSAAARRRAAALVATFPDSGPIPYREGVWLASLPAQLGDREGALGLLNRVRPIGPTFGRYLVHPAFDAFAQIRFQTGYPRPPA